jgi:20S proteasome subunit alpha 5
MLCPWLPLYINITNVIYRSLTLKEAETLTLRTLKQVMEEKLDAKNVQLSSITKDGFRIYSDEEMKECVGQLEGN